MSAVKTRKIGKKLLIGRNEWCQLPDLNIPAIKAKIDTGAKTSALHAFNIEPINIKGKKYVCFDVHPIQGRDDVIVRCKALVADERAIMSSNGHKEHRYVITTPLKIGAKTWNIELTLSNRDPLRYRMLLGREALNNRTLIYTGITCNQGKIPKKMLIRIYSP